jgi:hypothetical protein
MQSSHVVTVVVVGLSLVAACHSASDPAPARASARAIVPAPEPSVLKPEEVVRRDVATLTGGDLEGFVALYAPDAKIFGAPEDPHALVGALWEKMSGKDKLRAYFEKALAKKPLPRLEVISSVALADLVAAQVRITDPPGYDAATDVLAVYRVRAGLITDLWHLTSEAQPANRIGKHPVEVLRDLMAAGNRVDLEGWLALFSPDARQFKRATDPDQLANIPSTKAYDQASRRKAYEAAFAATPHGRADIYGTVSVGDLVASRGSFTFPDQVINTLTVYRVRDGLIQDIWDVEQVKVPVAPK